MTLMKSKRKSWNSLLLVKKSLGNVRNAPVRVTSESCIRSVPEAVGPAEEK